jgi:hypothetical protein
LAQENNMNSYQLARDKFNALFAAYDAKDRPAAVQQQPASKAAEKAVNEDRQVTMSRDQKNARSLD